MYKRNRNKNTESKHYGHIVIKRLHIFIQFDPVLYTFHIRVCRKMHKRCTMVSSQCHQNVMHNLNAIGECMWFNSHIAVNRNLIFSTKQYQPRSSHSPVPSSSQLINGNYVIHCKLRRVTVTTSAAAVAAVTEVVVFMLWRPFPFFGLFCWSAAN